MTRRRRVKLGLALGGGAARGLAHLGVLRVLRRAGYWPDIVVGTSFGALIGGTVLALDADVEGVVDLVLRHVVGEEFRRSQLNFFRSRAGAERQGLLPSLRNLLRRGVYYGFSATRGSFIPQGEFRASIEAIVPEARIEGLPGRFAAVAADIHSGEAALLDRGSLRLAVQASCAIPGIMPPVLLAGGRTLIDGGWVDKVPVDACRSLGADVVVAVDVSDDLADTVDLTTGLNVLLRAEALKANRLKVLQLARADVLIACPVQGIGWADFPRAAEAIAIGEQAAVACLPAVSEALDRAGRGRLTRRWLGGLARHLAGLPPGLATAIRLEAAAPARAAAIAPEGGDGPTAASEPES